VFINLKKSKRKDLTDILVVKSPNTPAACLLPLTNPFIFHPSFSILPDLVSNNTPISFP
jgi:hypothetical protein